LLPYWGLERKGIPGTEGLIEENQLWASLPACPDVYTGFKCQHMTNLWSRSCNPEHQGGTFAFLNAENSFRSAVHKVKELPSFVVFTCCLRANPEDGS